MRTLIKRLLYPILSRWYRRNNASVQSYSRYGITLTILPGVFHPGYFLSTNLLIDFLSATDLNGKRLLELGAGSGLVSFYAAKNGSIVTATDINPVALEGLQKNALANELPITVLKADLLEGISADAFDCIVINPPNNRLCRSTLSCATKLLCINPTCFNGNLRNSSRKRCK